MSRKLFGWQCSVGILVVGVSAFTWGRQSAPESRSVVEAIPLATGETIRVDGQLDEAVWQRAAPASGFKQRDPINGAPATEPTEVRVVFDSDRLYLGVYCFDSEPGRLLGNQMQRDQPFSGDDRFMWALDPYSDGRTGYFFEVNPSGAMGDGLIVSGSTGSNLGAAIRKDWDGIWLAHVRRHNEGWTAEIEIPFRTLNFDASAQAWGANFQRTVRRKNEESLWTGWERNQGLTRMSNAGAIVGLREISQGLGLEIQPYGLGELTEDSQGNLSSEADAGIDLFYSLTPGLRASLTVNTDFAETEVDQRRVNLTQFPLFFPEKRDFFLEGSNFFDFSREPGNAIVPFFSRRIGLDENGVPQKIDYGAKLTGQLGAYDVGVLHVRTGTEDSIPGEQFTVFRTRRRFYSQSYLGAILTRRAQADSSLPDFYTGGMDFELATSEFRGSENLRLSGFWLRNNTPSLTDGMGAAWGFRLDYPNDPWSWRLNFREAQRDYDPAVGFNARNDYRRYHPVMRFSSRPSDHRFVRRISFEAWNELLTDTDNDFIHREHRLNLFELELHSGETLRLMLNPKRERLEKDFEIHPGVVLPANSEYGYTRYAVEASTGTHRKVSGSADYEWGEFFNGRRRQFATTLSLRPRPGLFASLSGEWNRVELAEGRFSTAVLQTIVNTQFSPWISFANNIQYDTESGVLGWQSRFRWILHPGNDLYVVYLHNWIDQFSQFSILDRSVATKFVYTHRF